MKLENQSQPETYWKKRAVINSGQNLLLSGDLLLSLCADNQLTITNTIFNKINERISIHSLRFKLDSQPQYNTIEIEWKRIKEGTFKAAFDTLGPATRKNDDRFDQNINLIQPLITIKNNAWKEAICNPTHLSKATLAHERSTLQCCTRRAKNSWLLNKARAIQAYADRRLKNFLCVNKRNIRTSKLKRCTTQK